MNVDIDNRRLSLFIRWLGIYMLLLITGAMNIGAAGSLLKIIALVPVGIWVYFTHKIIKNRVFVASFIYFMYLSASFVWSIDQPNTATRIVTQLTFIILICAISGYEYTNYEINYLKNCLVWSSRITAVVVLLSADYFEGRIYLNGVVNEDPNYLCAYFLFGIISCLQILFSKGKLKKKIATLLEIAVYIYIIIGTGSRGGALGIIAAAFVFILFYQDIEKSHMNSIVKKIAAVLAVAIALSVAVSYISSDILGRFSLTELQKTKGTGRFDIWQSALNAYANSSIFRQFFGYGSGSAKAITYIFPFKWHLVFHNIFIENLLELGAIGLLLYIIFISSFLSTAIKIRNIFCISIMIGFIVLSLSVSISTFKPYWNIMFFIFCNSLENDATS